MARYTGPKAKISRKFRQDILGGVKAIEKKPYAPGQHGAMTKRAKKSEYAVQLMEKQKAKYLYGILEKQFHNLFVKAARMQGVKGENLLILCEARLDNTVYRLGIAPTRRAARQLVTHAHILVNDSVVNIPSYTLKSGDVIAVREKSRSFIQVTSSSRYDWLSWDMNTMRGLFIQNPQRVQIPENIREQLIVELYSK